VLASASHTIGMAIALQVYRLSDRVVLEIQPPTSA
jgi:hypothetical protein